MDFYVNVAIALPAPKIYSTKLKQLLGTVCCELYGSWIYMPVYDNVGEQ